MPVVVVQLWEGRSVEQKRQLVRAITEAMVQFADASPDALHVAIQEYSREQWARGGVLATDMEPHTPPAERPPQVWKLDHVLLEVADLDAACSFYCGLLGLSVRKRDRHRDGRPLVVTEQGLGLTTGGGRPGTTEHLAFRTRNVAKLAERLRDEDVEIVDGPMETEYGVSLYVRDPDGNKIELFGQR